MLAISTDDVAKALRFAGDDPLGILTSCARVVAEAGQVTIDREAIDRLVDELASNRTSLPDWDADLHFRGSGPDADEQTVGWIFVLDALNFCFWAQGDDPNDRWRVSWHGTTHDGYVALAVALRRAVEDDRMPLWDPDWLRTVDESTVRQMLRPASGCPEIPLFRTRVEHLRELGRNLADEMPSAAPFTSFVAHAGGSAVELVRRIVEWFPSFNDVAIWRGPAGDGVTHEIRFYKRAQILVADLAGALDNKGIGAFHDRDRLTAFADYKVPQVLRRFGILHYAPALLDRIQNRELIPAGSPPELEIRAATIWSCELIRQALAGRSSPVAPAAAYEIDWLLWQAGQSLPAGSEPYHRTRTVYY